MCKPILGAGESLRICIVERARAISAEEGEILSSQISVGGVVGVEIPDLIALGSCG